MSKDQALIQALQARIASLETEAKILRDRRRAADNNVVTQKRYARQCEQHAERLTHKLEERTIRVRRLEKACKLGLGNLRKQDSEGVYWCLTTQQFDKHHAGSQAPGCRYCRVYKAVTDAIEGRDIDDGYTPALSGEFEAVS
jgi:predicted RNase H-like nuclease (RuvC/YqgF family)